MDSKRYDVEASAVLFVREYINEVIDNPSIDREAPAEG
jgi:hypothetical protein